MAVYPLGQSAEPMSETPPTQVPGPARFRAFISYRQIAPDNAVAERLHRLLESFRTPRSLRRQGAQARVGRVFIDREELKVGPLKQSIREALASSDFLVVVCSPRTPSSPWVEEEVKGFLSTHGEEHVLPLLVEGDPEVSFPSALAHGAQLSLGRAHPSLEGDLRRLPGQAFAILAPLLGCDPAKLFREVQSRRRWRVGWTATAVAVPILAALAIRLGTLHFSEHRGRIVLEEGIAALHPALGSDTVVVDTGFKSEDVSSRGVLAVQKETWCVPRRTALARSCFAELEAWRREGLERRLDNTAERFWLPTADLVHEAGDDHLRARVLGYLATRVADCGIPLDTARRAAQTQIEFGATAGPVLRALRQRLACTVPEDPFDVGELARLVGVSSVTPLLVERLADANPGRVFEATVELNLLGVEEPRVVDTLRRLLRRSSLGSNPPAGPEVACHAACKLLFLLHRDQEAERLLQSRLLPDRPGDVLPVEAAFCLAETVPIAPEIRARLAANLDDKEMAGTALSTLGFLRRHDRALAETLRPRLADPRPEVVLMAAQGVLAAESHDPEALLQMQPLLRLPMTSGSVPGQEPLFLRAAAVLLQIPEEREAAVAALGSYLTDQDPRAMLKAAQLLIQNGETKRAPAILVRRLRELSGDYLLAAADALSGLPEGRQARAEALRDYMRKAFGPSSPSEGFFAFAQRLARISGLTPDLRAQLDQALDNDEAAALSYAKIVLLDPAEPPDRAADRLWAEIRSPRAEKSSPYRRAVGQAIALVAQEKSLGENAMHKLQGRLADLQRREERSYLRATASEILASIERYRRLPPPDLITSAPLR